VKSENDGALKNSVPLYGTAHVQLGLRSWLERHVGGSPAQFLEVVYEGSAWFDCPVVLQYCSVLPWLQIGFPESMSFLLYWDPPTVMDVI
jgi:hypothetical protein